MIIHIATQLNFHDKRNTVISLPTRIEQGDIKLGEIDIHYSVEVRDTDSLIQTKIPNRGYLINNILVYENGCNIGFRNAENHISTYDFNTQPQLIITNKKRFPLENSEQILWCYQTENISIQRR